MPRSATVPTRYTVDQGRMCRSSEHDSNLIDALSHAAETLKQPGRAPTVFITSINGATI